MDWMYWAASGIWVMLILLWWVCIGLSVLAWARDTGRVYERPSALVLDAWEQWHRETRREHPVQYFFRESLPLAVRRLVGRWVRCSWWFKHRFVPWHRYHVCPTGLSPGYHDVEDRMLHVNFQLLVQWVKSNPPGDNAEDEIIWELNHYWTVRRQLLADEERYQEDQRYLHRLIDIRPYLR